MFCIKVIIENSFNLLDNQKRARSGELAPLSPRKIKDGLTNHTNIYRERAPRPMSPNQQIDLMLHIEREERKTLGEPSAVDMEVYSASDSVIEHAHIVPCRSVL